MRVLVFLSVFLAAAMQQVQGQDPNWISVGTLPTLAHDVSGEFYIVDNKTAMILNFTYDGLGPAAFLYFYPWSFETVEAYEPGGGIKIPVVNTTNVDGSFERGEAYDSAELRIELPPEWCMCDFAWFSIWCEDFNQSFTAIEFQPAYFATDAGSAVAGTSIYCFPASIGEGRWLYVGEMVELAHDVTGNLWILDQNTFIIVNFNYDGLGPAAYLYFYDLSFAEVDMTGGGVKIYITDEMSKFEVGRSFDNELFVIHLPDDWNACDFAWFTIWCEDFDQTFTEVAIDPNLFANVRSSAVAESTLFCYPASIEEDRWVFVGEMETLAHDVSGYLYLIDKKTFVIVNFNYDGLGPAAYLYFYDTTFDEPNMFGGGVKIDISDDMPKFEHDVPYADAEFVIRLPDEYDACDFAWFTIWCEDFNQTFTEVYINPNLFVATGGEVTMGETVQCEVPMTPGSGVASAASLLTIAILALGTLAFA